MISPFYSHYKLRSKLFILKTNICDADKVNVLKPFLDNHVDIIKWNIDIEDVDNVLKIETTKSLSEIVIIKQVKAFGFTCDVLED
ncbi:hypothetical protein [uncultured Algibacter sp.]|uniref:hypothetical protein n=1 Tax=uncultured Algibacter sp. TaxID=298659 RepID=UPI0026273B4D|nr:hypothetical protein [uncultured Algibacter sp.]